MKYSGDFETATWKDDETWVWAWATVQIGKEENIVYGNSIESFFNWCYNVSNPEVYFHNLKFDGSFIIAYLLENGYKWVKDKKERETKSFTTLISDMGQFYQIVVYFEVGNKKVRKVTFFDSLKIIPFSVSDIAKSFNLEEQKLLIDYKLEREKGHILTPEEKDYIKNDVVIVSKALNVLFSQNLKKMTQGSNALSDFKEMVTISRFEHYFPNLEVELDKWIRQSYKGGFTYLNPIYKEKEVGEGVVLDVNSLYPSVMRDHKNLLPYGEPKHYVGKYQEDKVYPLYIQSITCSFEIKKDHIPTIQLKDKHYMWSFLPNEYVESSNNEIINLVLTNVDLDLFFEHYNVYDLQFIEGYKFKGFTGIFDEYIDKWIKVKIDSTKSGNKGMRTLAKLMLNALYGKFATSLVGQSKIPYLDEEGILRFEFSEKEERKRCISSNGYFYNCLCKKQNN